MRKLQLASPCLTLLQSVGEDARRRRVGSVSYHTAILQSAALHSPSLKQRGLQEQISDFA